MAKTPKRTRPEQHTVKNTPIKQITQGKNIDRKHTHTQTPKIKTKIQEKQSTVGRQHATHTEEIMYVEKNTHRKHAQKKTHTQTETHTGK